MFYVRVEYEGNNAKVQFPCDESYLCSQLEALHVKDMTNTTLYVDTIACETLKNLEKQKLDLDILNFLAKRMESLDEESLKKLEMVAIKKQTNTIKDFINLTYNLQRYTVIQDLSSMRSLESGLPKEKFSAYDFKKVWKKQVDQGTLVQGNLLFENEEVVYKEIFNGQTIPSNLYNDDKLIEAAIAFQDKTEFVCLPDIPVVIDKAVKRLGAESLDVCQVKLVDFGIDNSAWFGKFKKFLEHDGLYAVNELADWINKLDSECMLESLDAICEYAAVSDMKSMIKLKGNMDKFSYFQGVYNAKDVGELWITINWNYSIHEDIRKYFNYEQLGKDIMENFGGKFVKNGVVLFRGESVEELLQPNEAKYSDSKMESINGL